MRIVIVVALLLGAAGLALGVVSLLEGDEGEAEELTLTLTVAEGDFKVNDVAPRGTSEEDISSGDSFVLPGRSPASGKASSLEPARSRT